MSTTRIIPTVPDHLPEVLAQFKESLGGYIFNFSPQSLFAVVAEGIVDHIAPTAEVEDDCDEVFRSTYAAYRSKPSASDFLMQVPLSDMVSLGIKINFTGAIQVKRFGNDAVQFNPEDFAITLDTLSLQFVDENEFFVLEDLGINLTPSHKGEFHATSPFEYYLIQDKSLQNSGFLTIDQFNSIVDDLHNRGVSDDSDHSQLVEMLIEYTSLGEIL